jgi:hypothetical protein
LEFHVSLALITKRIRNKEDQMSDLEGKVIEQKSQREPVMLRSAAIARRVDALFRAMSTDFLLREQFVTDPVQITSEYVYGTRMPTQKASVTNQLVYSVMANQGLLGWLRDYSIKHRGQPPSKQKFISDFGRAVVDHGGYHVVLALLRGSVQKEDVFGFDEALLPVIFGIFTPSRILAEGTEMSTGTGGTQMSTGTGGTEMSTGSRVFREDISSRVLAEGTEMSTGTGGTQMSTGTATTEMSTGSRVFEEAVAGRILAEGTEMSTGTGGTQMSTGTATTEMSTGNLVFEAGTEMSTGTGGTQMSTGTGGTEHSIGFFGPSHVLVTLEALAQYATQLRAAGALEVIE